MTRNVLKPFGSVRVALALAVGLPLLIVSNAFAQDRPLPQPRTQARQLAVQPPAARPKSSELSLPVRTSRRQKKSARTRSIPIARTTSPAWVFVRRLTCPETAGGVRFGHQRKQHQRR